MLKEPTTIITGVPRGCHPGSDADIHEAANLATFSAFSENRPPGYNNILGFFSDILVI